MKNALLFCIFSILSFTLLSCDKEEDSLPQTPRMDLLYSLNPYEYLGVEHNILMEHFYAHVTADSFEFVDYYSNRSACYDQLATIALQGYHETGIDTSITYNEVRAVYDNIELGTILTNGPYEYFQTNFWDRFATMMDNEIIPNNSTNDAYWLNRIKNLLWNASNQNFQQMDSLFPHTSPGLIISQIHTLETEMLSFNWQPQDSVALKFMALLKHTANFWFEKIYNSNQELVSLNKKNRSKSVLLGTKEENRKQLKSALLTYAWWKILIICDMIGSYGGSGKALFAWEAACKSGAVNAWADNIANSVYP